MKGVAWRSLNINKSTLPCLIMEESISQNAPEELNILSIGNMEKFFEI